MNGPQRMVAELMALSNVEGETPPGADASAGALKWSGVLPRDGKYIITVTPTRAGAQHRLALAIKQAARVSISIGMISPAATRS